MDRFWLDWTALAVIFAVLGWVAYHFSRRTYRLCVFAVIVAGLIAVMSYGLHLGGRPGNFLTGLIHGGDQISDHMLSPLIPASLRHTVVPGTAGWLLLLLLTGGLLVAFDTLATRRQQPTVTVAPMPAGSDLKDPEVKARSVITEELRFRLPAVAVHAPASMPGGSNLQSLAAVVSESGMQGSKLTAALMQAVHALEARPRTYEVQLFVEHCRPDGQVDPEGPNLLVTVDMRDARNGQTVATRIMRPCSVADAAETVAGFTARQIFRQDASTPAWATGSFDGDDLSAYLLTREMRPVGRTFDDFAGCRQRQRERLAEAVSRSVNAGLVQYELASLDDLDGQTADSLRQHLDNRAHNPYFLPARYRLAVTLSALGSPVFRRWPAAAPPAGDTADRQAEACLLDDIVRLLQRSGLLRALGKREFRRLGLAAGRMPDRPGREQRLLALLRTDHPTGDSARRIRQVLQLLARREMKAYRHRMRAASLLWGCLRHRAQRVAFLELLRTEPVWWRHPRRRLWVAWVALKVIDQRLLRLEDPGDETDAALAATQARVRRRLRVGRVLDHGRAWRYGQVPWQAVYNAACLYAVPPSRRSAGPARPLGDQEASNAIELLRLAISDPACELDRPSEWISTDPSLRSLRGKKVFRDFVREQAARDFAPGAHNACADEWFRELLPTLTQQPGPPAPVSPDGQRPVHISWIRRLIQPRHLVS